MRRQALLYKNLIFCLLTARFNKLLRKKTLVKNTEINGTIINNKNTSSKKLVEIN